MPITALKSVSEERSGASTETPSSESRLPEKATVSVDRELSVRRKQGEEEPCGSGHL